MWAVGDVEVSHDAVGTSMPLGVNVVHIDVAAVDAAHVDVADVDVGGGRR